LYPFNDIITAEKNKLASERPMKSDGERVFAGMEKEKRNEGGAPRGAISLYGDTDLKKKTGKRKKKNIKKRNIRIFMITFVLIVSAGVLLLGIMKLTGTDDVGGQEELSQITTVEEEEINSSASEKAVENTEEGITEEKEEPAKEAESGLGEDGCLRNENGRILVKKQETAGEEATLLFAGDILFDDSYTIMISMRQREGGIAGSFSPEILAEMASADIFMLNNEFTYTDRGTPTEGKQYTFRAKPENAAFLKELGVDIVSLANNHAYDYGEVSLLDSLATLENIDMPYVGAGRNLSEASQPVYFEAGNQKIAFIAGTQIERQPNPDTKGATEEAAGVFRCFQETEIFDKIREAKENSDFVVVYIHWGTEKTDELDWAQPDMAKNLAAAGADLIIGDHPHVLQPLANVDGVPTIYSLGNYWFNSSTLNTCLVKVVLQDGEMQSFQFLPALQSNCYTKLLTGAEKEEALAYMRAISDTVTIDSEGYVTF